MSDIAVKKSLIFSIVVHVVFLSLLVFTMNNNDAQRPIIINLQKSSQSNDIVKAGVVDRGAIDRAHQLRAREERLKAEQALEVANTQKLAQEKLAQEKIAQEKAVQDRIMQKKMVQEKAMQAKAAQEKATQLKVAQEKLVQEKVNLAKQQKIKQEQRAAGIQAERDSLRAQHDAFIGTEIDKYKAEFAAAIIENRILSSIFAGDLQCTIRIMLLPDGSILNVNIEKSSGNKAYDEMAENAVYKTAPFPMPDEQELYSKLRDIVISFRNGDQATDVL